MQVKRWSTLLRDLKCLGIQESDREPEGFAEDEKLS